MMDKDSKKQVAQMDGTLAMKVGRDENIFLHCQQVTDAVQARDEAIKYRESKRKENILQAFRKCVAEFEREFGFSPTQALMCYDDRQAIDTAFREECDAIGIDHNYMVVDGIKICGGCTQTSGQIQLRKSIEGV